MNDIVKYRLLLYVYVGYPHPSPPSPKRPICINLRNGLWQKSTSVHLLATLLLTELRYSLGLCSYCGRFIPGFADVATPLHVLQWKNVRFDICLRACGYRSATAGFEFSCWTLAINALTNLLYRDELPRLLRIRRPYRLCSKLLLAQSASSFCLSQTVFPLLFI